MRKALNVLIVLSFLLTGCINNGKLSEEAIVEQNHKIDEQQILLEEYQQKLQISEKRIRELTEEVELWKYRLESQSDYTHFMEGTVSNFQELLHNTHHVISQSLGHEDTSKILGVFDPNSVTEGSQVGKLTVEKVNIEKENDEIKQYFIHFSGELQLTGLVSIDNAHGGYRFTLDNQHFNQIPHARHDLRYGKVSFKIRNEDVFEAALDEALYEALSDRESIVMRAVFDNYTANFIAESHMSNHATFIRFITE